MKDFTLALAKSALFRHVKMDSMHSFIKSASILTKQYQKGDFIALSGEPMEGIGVMLEGSARLVRENMLGQRSIVTDLKKSDIFGEALLFTDRPEWPATIQATTAAMVLFIPFAAFANPLPHHEALQSQLLLNLLHDISEKALILNRKVHYLTLKGMRDRIFAYLYDQYRVQKSLVLHLPHNRQEMSEVLNVSRPSMSRELGLLDKSGILKVMGRTITILEPSALSINDILSDSSSE